MSKQERLLPILKGTEPTLGPSTVSIHPTNACQLNCITCWHYSPLGPVQHSDDWKKKRIPLEVYKKLVDELVELKVENIVYSGGGDPLAHPEILDFIEYTSSKKVSSQMVSNLLLAKDIERLAKSGINYIVSNCSAGSPEVYTKFHPNQKFDSFYKFEENVSHLVKSGVQVELSCIMSNVNYTDVPNMLLFAARTSKLIRFKNIHLQEAEGLGIKDSLMNEEQIGFLQKMLPNYIELANALKLNHNLQTYTKYLKADYKGSNNFPVESVSCYAPYYNTAIRANGNVVVCPYGPIENDGDGVLGNIHKQSFKEIWFSEKYKEMRERLRCRKYFDFCQYCEYFPYFKNNKDLTALADKYQEQKKHKQ